MEKQPLTTRQKEILEYMENFTQDCGYPPTVREICKATGLKSPRSVSQHLQALERKGYIQRGRDKSRAIRFLHKSTTVGSTFPETVRALPLLGKVAAGRPTAMSERVEGTFYVDKQLVAGDKSFLMKVEGRSMVNAHIVQGDMIVVDPDQDTMSGDIVVAKIGGEATVKRYQRRDTRVYLVPENDSMKPIDITSEGDNVKIVGKVVGLIRQMQ